MEKFANLNSGFALQFFKQVAKDGQSSFLSPASITAALAMTYAGADGQTKIQMNDLLFRGLNDQEINEGVQQMIKTINTPVDGYTLKTANRLYIEKSYQALQSFLDIVQKYHHSDCISCDFVKEGAKTAKDINAWVEHTTNGKIKDLIKPDLLTPLTRLVLVNAIYFKGDWKNEFDEKCTTKQPFHVTADQAKDVDMMHMKKEFLFAENDKCKVLGIEYISPDVAMYFVLPKTRNGLHEFEQSLRVDLPKFKLESEYELNNSFKQLGCTDMFDRADFSKISGAKDLSVSNIVHKAFVEAELLDLCCVYDGSVCTKSANLSSSAPLTWVNEKGAEAAAATAVVMMLKCGKKVPKEKLHFKADHPFLFAIVERNTMIILFLGHYFG